MTKATTKLFNWLYDVEEHDYPAAAAYLTILFNEDRVAEMIAQLRSAAMVQFKGKDTFRASQLSLLGISNLHVEKERKKIQNAKSLSTLLLVREPQNGKVIIADGYHWLCAIYELIEDELIHCKIKQV